MYTNRTPNHKSSKNEFRPPSNGTQCSMSTMSSYEEEQEESCSFISNSTTSLCLVVPGGKDQMQAVDSRYTLTSVNDTILNTGDHTLSFMQRSPDSKSQSFYNQSEQKFFDEESDHTIIEDTGFKKNTEKSVAFLVPEGKAVNINLDNTSKLKPQAPHLQKMFPFQTQSNKAHSYHNRPQEAYYSNPKQHSALKIGPICQSHKTLDSSSVFENQSSNFADDEREFEDGLADEEDFTDEYDDGDDDTENDDTFQQTINSSLKHSKQNKRLNQENCALNQYKNQVYNQGQVETSLQNSRQEISQNYFKYPSLDLSNGNKFISSNLFDSNSKMKSVNTIPNNLQVCDSSSVYSDRDLSDYSAQTSREKFSSVNSSIQYWHDADHNKPPFDWQREAEFLSFQISFKDKENKALMNKLKQKESQIAELDNSEKQRIEMEVTIGAFKKEIESFKKVLEYNKNSSKNVKQVLKFVKENLSRNDKHGTTKLRDCVEDLIDKDLTLETSSLAISRDYMDSNLDEIKSLVKELASQADTLKSIANLTTNSKTTHQCQHEISKTLSGSRSTSTSVSTSTVSTSINTNNRSSPTPYTSSENPKIAALRKKEKKLRSNMKDY